MIPGRRDFAQARSAAYSLGVMNRLRPYVSAFLGLVLLVQGFAVAAAGHPAAAADAAAAQAVADAAMMPCHGSAASDRATTPNCCDEACPDMTTCALGHLALATSLQVAVVPPSSDFVAGLVPAPATVTSQSLLRPPIVLFA
jgi:hypothetical protein